MCESSNCGHGERHHPHHSHYRHSIGHEDCCCGGTHRDSISKEERVKRLKQYKEELETELTNVNELLEEKL